MKQIRASFTGIAPHLLPHRAVDAISTYNNVSGVGASILSLNMHIALGLVYARDAFPRHDSIFEFKVVE